MCGGLLGVVLCVYTLHPIPCTGQGMLGGATCCDEPCCRVHAGVLLLVGLPAVLLLRRRERRRRRGKGLLLPATQQEGGPWSPSAGAG